MSFFQDRGSLRKVSCCVGKVALLHMHGPECKSPRPTGRIEPHDRLECPLGVGRLALAEESQTGAAEKVHEDAQIISPLVDAVGCLPIRRYGSYQEQDG